MNRSPIQQMVDRACGFTPEEAARVDAERKASQDADTERLLAVAEAALWWWSCNKPVGWTLAKHRRNPTVNCAYDSQAQLARAAAALSIAGWPIRKPKNAP